MVSGEVVRRVDQPNTSLLVDVTSVIGAEDYVVSQNHRTRPADPFARQCFAELVQSLIFMTRVLVAHPTLPSPRDVDFGERPRLLRSLMRAGLLYPLRLEEDAQLAGAATLEDEALHDLKSWQGSRSVIRFIEQAIACDSVAADRAPAMATRIRNWSSFQAEKVRVAGHHRDRITTSDGIEDDAFGVWARAAALTLEGALERIAPVDEGKYVMATLARGLKYRARAEAAGLCYQSHPMRRDFNLTFDLTRDGAGRNVVFDVIKAVRGIHESLAEAAGQHESHRIKLLELELPLLGGRLWRPAEVGRHPDPAWIDLVVDRIAQYRAGATELRRAIARCVTDEDFLRLARDIDSVRRQLLERLGLRPVALSATERELVETVASVAQAAPGVPKMSGLWFGVRAVGKQFAFTGQPFQRFLYREFVGSWRRAAK